MKIVLDTSALIYWTLDPGKLTSPAEQAITTAEQIVVSSISIWEIGLKAKRNRLELPLSIHAYADKLHRLQGVDVQAVSTAVWLENLALDWEHRDPADRTIVAVARLNGCSLITSDRAMQAFYPQTIW